MNEIILLDTFFFKNIIIKEQNLCLNVGLGTPYRYINITCTI